VPDRGHEHPEHRADHRSGEEHDHKAAH
jgi:hypothetical protein